MYIFLLVVLLVVLLVTYLLREIFVIFVYCYLLRGCTHVCLLLFFVSCFKRGSSQTSLFHLGRFISLSQSHFVLPLKTGIAITHYQLSRNRCRAFAYSLSGDYMTVQKGGQQC